MNARDRVGLDGPPPRSGYPSLLLPAIVLAATALTGCARPELREVPEIKAAQLRARCGVEQPPVTLEQARCIAGAVGLDTAEGAVTFEEGTSLYRDAIWIVREACAVNPQCVENWIRRSDGAIVNTRYLYVFGSPSKPVSPQVGAL